MSKGKEICKFELQIQNEQTIYIPKGAKILSAQMQNGKPYAYALIEPANSTEEILIEVYITGYEMSKLKPGTVREFIGTVEMQDRNVALHIFKLKN